MDDLEVVKAAMKQKRGYKKPQKVVRKHSRFKRPIVCFMITVIVTLGTMIVLKGNAQAKTWFYKNVYDTNFSFMTFNNWYEKTFGNPLPFKDLWKDKVTTPVFNEKLEYTKKEAYQEGAKLTVSSNYLIPSLESGMVVFIGEKENYGNTVIIQQVNGIDVWYGNIKNSNVKLYDYIEKGSLIGEVNETNLYLVFRKDGNAQKYEDYL